MAGNAYQCRLFDRHLGRGLLDWHDTWYLRGKGVSIAPPAIWQAAFFYADKALNFERIGLLGFRQVNLQGLERCFLLHLLLEQGATTARTASCRARVADRARCDATLLEWLVDDVADVLRAVDRQSEDVVDLTVIQVAVVVDIYLRAAHDARDRCSVVVLGKQVEIVLVLLLVLHLIREATKTIVVERVHTVEFDALGALQLVFVEILELALVRWQERAVDVVDKIDLQRRINSVAAVVELVEAAHDVTENTGTALPVASELSEVGKARDDLDLVANVDIYEVLVIRELEDDKVAADDDFVGNLGCLADKPLDVGVHLWGATRDIHRFIAAGLERDKYGLHRLAAHALRVLRTTLEVAVVAGEIALVCDIDLHRLHLSSVEKTLVVNALFPRLDANLRARLVELFEAKVVLALHEAQSLVGPLEVVGTAMLLGGRDLEMVGVAARLEHRRHVATDGNGAALDHTNVATQVEVALVLGHRAEICCDLAVVLLARLETVAFDGADRVGVEADASELRRDAQIANVDLVALDVIKRRHAVFGEHRAEVFDIHSAGETLTAQDRIVVEALRNTSVGEDVGEEELAARLQDAKHLFEQLFFEWREVDHAVGDHDVDALVRDNGHVLDEALDELHVALLEAEALHLGVFVLARESELGRSHIDADNPASGTDELRADVDVAARTTSEIEYRCALKCRGDGASASIEALHDLVFNILHCVDDVLWRRR